MFVSRDLCTLIETSQRTSAGVGNRSPQVSACKASVSFGVFVLVGFQLSMNSLWLWGCTRPWVCVVYVWPCGCVQVAKRVLNMCWRSQRNSRALIRTCPGQQLVNSVLRIGVLYSHTMECKLVPLPSGHWEQIHMAHTLPETSIEGCTAMQLTSIKRKTSKDNDESFLHSCFLSLFVCACVCMCVWVQPHAATYCQFQSLQRHEHARHSHWRTLNQPTTTRCKLYALFMPGCRIRPRVPVTGSERSKVFTPQQHLRAQQKSTPVSLVSNINFLENCNYSSTSKSFLHWSE